MFNNTHLKPSFRKSVIPSDLVFKTARLGRIGLHTSSISCLTKELYTAGTYEFSLKKSFL